MSDREIDLAKILEKLTSRELIEEIEERADANDEAVLAFYDSIADEYAEDEPEPDLEPWFERMTEWDRDELRKAIREDDGRRCVDLLKRAMVTC